MIAMIRPFSHACFWPKQQRLQGCHPELTAFLYAHLKNGRIMPWQCPSIRPSQVSGLFSAWFEISSLNLVQQLERNQSMWWHLRFSAGICAETLKRNCLGTGYIDKIHLVDVSMLNIACWAKCGIILAQHFEHVFTESRGMTTQIITHLGNTFSVH